MQHATGRHPHSTVCVKASTGFSQSQPQTIPVPHFINRTIAPHLCVVRCQKPDTDALTPPKKPRTPPPPPPLLLLLLSSALSVLLTLWMYPAPAWGLGCLCRKTPGVAAAPAGAAAAADVMTTPPPVGAAVPTDPLKGVLVVVEYTALVVEGMPVPVGACCCSSCLSSCAFVVLPMGLEPWTFSVLSCSTADDAVKPAGGRAGAAACKAPSSLVAVVVLLLLLLLLEVVAVWGCGSGSICTAGVPDAVRVDAGTAAAALAALAPPAAAAGPAGVRVLEVLVSYGIGAPCCCCCWFLWEVSGRGASTVSSRVGCSITL